MTVAAAAAAPAVTLGLHRWLLQILMPAIPSGLSSTMYCCIRQLLVSCCGIIKLNMLARDDVSQ